MKIIPVATQRPYEVRVERGLLSRLGAELAPLTSARHVALIADDTVDGLYGDKAEQALAREGFQVERMRFPHGESSKNLAAYAQMLDFLAEKRLTRADAVVALGGGVTGDMAGFAAATYLRGVALVQAPTTFLAMVDSAVGGKTGVDLPAGKNLVGAFWQPLCVLCDPDVLQTLPPATFADGTAEALKYGVLGSERLFDTLATGSFADALEDVIATCLTEKARLASEDETDRGSRQLLNLGHTIGHAIERCSGYAVSHGRAVAIGMVGATRIAVKMGLCGADCLARLIAALRANGLPTETDETPENLLNAALGDKKRMGDTITFVLPRRIGACELHPVPVTELGAMLATALEK